MISTYGLTLQALIAAYMTDQKVTAEELLARPPIAIGLICIRDDNYEGEIGSVHVIEPDNMIVSIEGDW